MSPKTTLREKIEIIVIAAAVFFLMISLFKCNKDFQTQEIDPQIQNKSISLDARLSPAPGNPSVTNITSNSATFKWGKSQGATQYRFKYTSDATWDTSIFTPDTFLNVSNLSSSKTYRFVIRKELPTKSNYTSEISFTTLPSVIIITPTRNTIFPQFNRIMYVNKSDTIYNNTQAKNRLCKYLKKYGFNGVYFYDTQRYLPNSANWSNFASFMKQLSDSGIYIRGIDFGNSAFFTSTVTNYNNSQSDTSKKVNTFHLENEYWNYGTNPDAVQYSTWINYLQQIKNTGIRTDFYMGYFRLMNNSIDTIVSRDMQRYSHNICEHVYVNGIPTFSFANNSTSPNGGRLDIYAKGARQNNTPLNLTWIISEESTNFGAAYTFSGNVLKANNSLPNPYDWLEQQSYNNIYNGMTAFHKQWITPRGFVHFNLSWCYAAVPPQ